MIMPTLWRNGTNIVESRLFRVGDRNCSLMVMVWHPNAAARHSSRATKNRCFFCHQYSCTRYSCCQCRAQTRSATANNNNVKTRCSNHPANQICYPTPRPALLTGSHNSKIEIFSQSKAPIYAPSLPTIVTEHTFWCGKPPRLCVKPKTGSSSRCRSSALPCICKYIS